MASVMKDAPKGFEATVEQMNQLQPESLTLLGTTVMQFLQYKVEAIETEQWCQKLKDEVKNISNERTQNLINALMYIYRNAVRHKLTDDQFKDQLSSSMVFSDTTQSSLCSVWSQQSQQLLSFSQSEHVLRVGQLLDIQWKVGLAISSDECKSLNSPIVTLQLAIADAAGDIKFYKLELTMKQFMTFTNQLKDIGRILETV